MIEQKIKIDLDKTHRRICNAIPDVKMTQTDSPAPTYIWKDENTDMELIIPTYFSKCPYLLNGIGYYNLENVLQIIELMGKDYDEFIKEHGITEEVQSLEGM